MPRRRYRRSERGPDLIGLIGVLLIGGGLSLARWWREQPPEGQLIVGIGTVMALGAGIGLIVLVQVERQRKRRLAWQRATADWISSRQTGRVPAYYSTEHMGAAELEKFAAQVYAKMGYRVTHTGRSGDHGVDVKLTRPDGQIELVQCKQWKNRPVGEPEVRDLYGAMMHLHAVRGFIWAPRGFTTAARRWCQGKPIVLADSREISRLVESAFGD